MCSGMPAAARPAGRGGSDGTAGQGDSGGGGGAGGETAEQAATSDHEVAPCGAGRWAVGAVDRWGRAAGADRAVVDVSASGGVSGLRGLLDGDGDMVDEQRAAGLGGVGGGGRAGHAVREGPAHRQVEQQEVPVVGRVRPGGGVHLRGVDGVELLAVDIPVQRFRGAVGAVELQRVGVESGLAGGVRAVAGVPLALRLVARPAGVDAAVQHAPDLVDAVDVLHDVELADAGPVPVVAAVVGAQRPERRPVAQRARHRRRRASGCSPRYGACRRPGPRSRCAGTRCGPRSSSPPSFSAVILRWPSPSSWRFSGRSV